MNTYIGESDYKVFTVNEKKFLYISGTGKIYEVDDRTIEVVNDLKEQKLSLENSIGNISMCENADDIIIEEIKKENIFGDHKKLREVTLNRIELNNISMVSLLVIQGCNLRCTYCYGENGQYQDAGVMDIETAMSSVDFLLRESKNNLLTICFFGGEPLLNFEVIKQVVNYCKELEKIHDKEIKFTMTTNGTLITDEIEKFIIEHRISVQISLDGDQKTQDENRFDALGKGSYETVIQRTKGLREKGMLGVRATLTPFNMEVNKIYKHLDALGFRKIIISPAFNMMTEKDYQVLADKYIEWYEDLEKELKNRNYKYVLKSKLFRQELKKINRALVRTSSCGVGKNMVAIDVHGNIFPCQRFVALKDYNIGSINEGVVSQKDFLDQLNCELNEKCQKCWIRNLCVSGCPFCNLSDCGEIHTQTESYCNYERKIYSALIPIYLRLSEEEKKILFK